jgi:hypothetical protein
MQLQPPVKREPFRPPPRIVEEDVPDGDNAADIGDAPKTLETEAPWPVDSDVAAAVSEAISAELESTPRDPEPPSIPAAAPIIALPPEDKGDDGQDFAAGVDANPSG